MIADLRRALDELRAPGSVTVPAPDPRLVRAAERQRAHAQWVRDYRAEMEALRVKRAGLEEDIATLYDSYLTDRVFGWGKGKPRTLTDLQRAHRVRLEARHVPDGVDRHVDLLRWSVARLADRHHVTLERSGHHRCAAAWKHKRLVRVPPINSDFSYAVALHEVGHVVDPRADGSRYRQTKTEDGHTISPQAEIGAWTFAKEQTLVPWSAAMQECLAGACASYLPYANAAERAEMEHLIDPRTPDQKLDAEIAGFRARRAAMQKVG